MRKQQQLVEVTYNVRVPEQHVPYFRDMFPDDKKQACLGVHVRRYSDEDRDNMPEIFESVSERPISTELNDNGCGYGFSDDGQQVEVPTIVDNARFFTSLSDDELVSLFTGRVFVDSFYDGDPVDMMCQGYRVIKPEQILV